MEVQRSRNPYPLLLYYGSVLQRSLQFCRDQRTRQHTDHQRTRRYDTHYPLRTNVSAIKRTRVYYRSAYLVLRISVPTDITDQRSRILQISVPGIADQRTHRYYGSAIAYITDQRTCYCGSAYPQILRISVPVDFTDQRTRRYSGSAYPSILRISVPVDITDQRTR
jgi:hypothetical protein